MQKTLVFLFVALYLTAMLRPVAPLFEYVVNEDYIAEFLCINQDRPELHCNGKCYLMQMLQEQNEEKHQNIPKINMEDYPIGFVNLFDISALHKAKLPTKAISYRNLLHAYLLTNRPFHPPIT